MNSASRCGIGLVFLLFLAVGPGCGQEVPAPTAPYAFLIIKDLSGKDDLIVSQGFPEYLPPEQADGESPATPAAERKEFPLLGTLVRIAVYDMPRDQARAAVDAAFERVHALGGKMNIFSPDSDISRINREAAMAPQKLDDDLYRVMKLSLEISELTDGAFDVTVGPLTSLWRRTWKEGGRLPNAEELADARARVGYKQVELDEMNRTIRFKREGMSFDLGGIAKGFASEEAAKVLLARGVRSAVIDCGGDLRLIGSRPGDRPFRVGIVDPMSGERNRFVVSLRNEAAVTSGNYLQFRIVEGKRRSHIIDPRTGESVAAFPSVTVTGSDSAVCDALATALSIVDGPTALTVIERANEKMGR